MSEVLVEISGNLVKNENSAKLLDENIVRQTKLLLAYPKAPPKSSL